MKTLSLAELTALDRAAWTITADVTANEFNVHDIPTDDDGSTRPEIERWYAGTLAVKHPDGIEIHATWGADGGRDSYMESFQFTLTLFRDDTLILRGAYLSDDNADYMPNEMRGILFDFLDGMSWRAAVEPLLPAPQLELVD